MKYGLLVLSHYLCQRRDQTKMKLVRKEMVLNIKHYFGYKCCIFNDKAHVSLFLQALSSCTQNLPIDVETLREKVHIQYLFTFL